MKHPEGTKVILRLKLEDVNGKPIRVLTILKRPDETYTAYCWTPTGELPSVLADYGNLADALAVWVTEIRAVNAYLEGVHHEQETS